MERHNFFLNAGGATTLANGGKGGGASWVELVGVAVEFGLQYLSAKAENKKDRELLERLSELDNQQSEKLKKLLNNSLNEVAKTQVIIDFLNAEKINSLDEETKNKRIIPLILLGFGVILIGIILYKLNKRNG